MAQERAVRALTWTVKGSLFNQELMVPSALDRDIFSTDSAIHQTSQGLDK